MKPFFSNGQWVAGSSHEAVHDPWTGEKLAEVTLADAAQVESAVAGAAEAFKTTRRMPASERAGILRTISDTIAARRSEFVSTIVAEAGKPVTFAEAEVDRAVLTFRFASAEALSDEGHGLAIDASAPGAGHWGFARRFPVGVILGITPFNFPLNLVAHKVAPCLATGNTMVLKPALKTPLSALLLAEALESAGVPSGQIQTIPFGHELVPDLLSDARIRMISFTGSAPVGWKLKGDAAKKKVALELGGNAAAVVEPDCDWRTAIPRIASGAFGYAGQSCISVQRILVQESIYDAFRDALCEHIVAKVACGDPTLRTTVVGPMINSAARQKVLAWIEEAVNAGAATLTPVEPSGLSLLPPVLLENVRPGCAALDEEAFAPLAVLQRYRDFDEALNLVNASVYGLQAGIFTSDLNKALRAFEEIEAGGVLVNQVPTFRVENMPYGGVKESGFGREGVRYAMEDMTELRSLIVNRG